MLGNQVIVGDHDQRFALLVQLVEYAQDTIASGKKKALIVLGHVVSEQAGMKYCAEWLKGFITEVPIEFIAAVEPFWRPDKPIL